jgi:hypothetical protein
MLSLSFLITSTVWPVANNLLHGRLQRGYRAIPNPHPGIVYSGLLQWTGETRTTVPKVTINTSSDGLNVAPAFQAYYQQHGGAAHLGAPITTPFVSSAGLMQVFTTTALVLVPHPGPTSARTPSADTSDEWAELVDQGIHDQHSGIVELPLLHSLLTAGSLARVAGSNITYADMRAATSPSRRVSERTNVSSPDWVFVPEDQSGNASTGHRVPVTLWQYINDPTNTPDGWLTDVGEPLTEALPFSATASDGTIHQEYIQAFWQTAFVVDEDTLDASGDPHIQRVSLGEDYLATLGYPAATTQAGTQNWTAKLTSITSAPGGPALAHVASNWPVTLSGSTRWVAGTLWYAVTWQAGHQTGLNGWILASALTSSAPPAGSAGMGMAGIDALSPPLATYLGQFDGGAAMAVFDVSRNRYYSFDANNTYVMGSSAKIPIMVTYLNWVEQQGRGLSGDEQWLLSTMIENSNNDSAQTLYDTVGGDPAINQYLDNIGVGSYIPNSNGWGWGALSPHQMVMLLDKLHSGQILKGQDRAYALSLMEQVESDQRFGVGDTAPASATVAMKDGWVVAPDGLWAASSSGIVTVGSETYVISVYTAEQSDLDTNHAILDHVCGAVAALLP